MFLASIHCHDSLLVQTHCGAVPHEVQINFVTQQLANVGNAVLDHRGSFK